jgi:hypothetical protein
MPAKSKSSDEPPWDATSRFFGELANRGYEPLLHGASGSVRFELSEGGDTERWLVIVKRGRATVSHAASRADCLVRTDRALFNGIVTGEVNAMAAMLRGDVVIDGDPELLMLFQRLIPGPPEHMDPSMRRGADG